MQNATLCSEPVSEGLDVGVKQGEPLVRVSVNTAILEDMDRLKEDLKLLSVLDPSLRVSLVLDFNLFFLCPFEDMFYVKVMELDNGELAMITAGEVHLQKCLKDLEDLGFMNLEVRFPTIASRLPRNVLSEGLETNSAFPGDDCAGCTADCCPHSGPDHGILSRFFFS